MPLSQAGSNAPQKWWVVYKQSGKQLIATVVASATRPASPGRPTLGPFATQKEALAAATPLKDRNPEQLSGPLAGPGSWIAGLGGSLASGIEGGAVAFLKDLWNVIVGPILVLVGVAVALWVLAVYFKNDIISLGTTVAKAAA